MAHGRARLGGQDRAQVALERVADLERRQAVRGRRGQRLDVVGPAGLLVGERRGASPDGPAARAPAGPAVDRAAVTASPARSRRIRRSPTRQAAKGSGAGLAFVAASAAASGAGSCAGAQAARRRGGRRRRAARAAAGRPASPPGGAAAGASSSVVGEPAVGAASAGPAASPAPPAPGARSRAAACRSPAGDRA
ncbi:MAG: hypothetical protein M9894_26310 [Planctomycetes bacterium]|nr:hypothetical protein [Planctomycetota bacterium]